jgi:hypothetical protein
MARLMVVGYPAAAGHDPKNIVEAGFIPARMSPRQ